MPLCYRPPPAQVDLLSVTRDSGILYTWKHRYSFFLASFNQHNYFEICSHYVGQYLQVLGLGLGLKWFQAIF